MKKVPLSAMCIDPSQFQAMGCETLDLSCAVPADCPFGLVCCVVFMPLPAVTCLPQQVCPGDGVNNLRICGADGECPRIGSVCETWVKGEQGLELKVCTP